MEQEKVLPLQNYFRFQTFTDQTLSLELNKFCVPLLSYYIMVFSFPPPVITYFIFFLTFSFSPVVLSLVLSFYFIFLMCHPILFSRSRRDLFSFLSFFSPLLSYLHFSRFPSFLFYLLIFFSPTPLFLISFFSFSSRTI